MLYCKVKISLKRDSISVKKRCQSEFEKHALETENEIKIIEGAVLIIHL